MRKIISLIGSEHKFTGFYSLFAEWWANICGKSSTFIISCSIIAIWAGLGPYYNYSDSYQLFINTGTTIVTFLMMFLLQNTQNRDTEAMQKKLDVLLLEISILNEKMKKQNNGTD
jgi:low affinity Fe/Cu permease